MTKLVRSLSSAFLRSATRFSDREALSVAVHRVSYQELAERAKRLAATLQAGATGGEVPLTAVFAYLSVTAYAAVLTTQLLLVGPDRSDVTDLAATFRRIGL